MILGIAIKICANNLFLPFKNLNCIRNGLNTGFKSQRCLFKLSTMFYTHRRHYVNDNARKEEIENTIKRNTCYEEFTSLGRLVSEDPAEVSGPHVRFKILDYNILAQTHMEHHMELYRKCPRQSLDWSFRKCILEREFEEFSPDIFCLQEVELTHKEELLGPWEKRGYEALYLWRGQKKPDGCAFLYNKSMFHVADYAEVNYHRREVQIMDRPNVGLVVKLELTQHPGNYLVVANTHLLYNQGRKDIKLCQLVLFLAEIERLAFNPSGQSDRYHPIILTGDLNVKPHSGLISLLQQGHVISQFITGKSKKKKKNSDGNKTKRIVPTDELESCLGLSLDGCLFRDVKDSRRRSLDSNENLEHPKKEDNSESAERLISPDIRHNFHFDHIHNHFELDRESTDKMQVFDYMFYSSPLKGHKQFQLQPGELRLLSRLRLPTCKEYRWQIRAIPNLAFGSDHFPLTATFLLGVSQK